MFYIMLNKLKNRWKSSTPSDWKKAQKIAIRLGILDGALMGSFAATNGLFPSLELFPTILIQILGYIAAISATIAATAQFTMEDTNDGHYNKETDNTK